MRGFLEQTRSIEERLFPDQLDAHDEVRMLKRDSYSWLYRPSHHIATGLITEADFNTLSRPHERLLSVGAFPGYFEHVLIELGLPAKHITAADIKKFDAPCHCEFFDATKKWPDLLGSFDLIIFPESLCIMIGDKLKRVVDSTLPFPNDEQEAILLATVLKEALRHLRRGGEIRANGPMSHPNVVKAASALLVEAGIQHEIVYDRFFLMVRPR